jgi:ribonucleoside-diphosphate reductase alpha chain
MSTASPNTVTQQNKRSVSDVIGGTRLDPVQAGEVSLTKDDFKGLFKEGFEVTEEMIMIVEELIHKNSTFLAGLDATKRTKFEGEGTKLEGVRQKVFLDRYALKDAEGNPIESVPEEMWARVAWGISQVENTPQLRRYWEKRFYQALDGFHFVPAGRILSGAGTGYAVTYYNCYVIPSPDDSRGGIVDNVKDMIEVMARAGGVGINLSSLRPKGSYIRTVNGHSSGPIAWGQLYSVATGDVISQGGSRRGALMLMLDDDHPDVEEFITCKTKPKWIEYANLSIAASDDFMTAIKEDKDWDLKWQGKVMKTVKARELWDKICEAAWKSAEPGFVWMERYNKWSNTHYYEDIRCVNPCGEQGLPKWGVCNLGALNLSAYVVDGVMDYKLLAEHTRTAMRFLDNVVDANYYFFKENQVTQLGTRRTGLGTMGLGDALIKMHVRYGSNESLEIIEKIYKTIRDHAYDESANIAKEKGAFAYFDKDKYLDSYFVKQLPEEIRNKIAEHGIRNAVLLTQAPTGTTSLVSGVSSGIEPVYDFAMVRRDRTGEHVIYHPLFQEWKDANPGKQDNEAPSYFASTRDLLPDDHVKVQALIQKYTDSSISKTVNAPNEYTIDQVKELYMKAYDMGCKGVTFYRDGSRDAVLTRVADEKKKEEPQAAVIKPPAVMPDRPTMLQGFTYRIQTPVGKGYVTINHDESGNPFEVFIAVSRAGSDIHADADAIGRLISLALRMPTLMEKSKVVEEIIDKLRGIGGGSVIGFGNGRVRSLADAIAKVLLEHMTMYGARNGEVLAVADNLPGNQNELKDQKPLFEEVFGAKVVERDLCNQCGQASLVREEGCMKCYSCGYSKC